MKVLFDKDNRLPGWTVAPTEGAILHPSDEAFEFTIEEWREGRDMWPRLLFSGPGIDLTGYSKLVFELEHKEKTGQNIALAARSTPDETSSLAAPLPPGAATRVQLDISDGAQLDQSNVNEIYLYMTRPPETATYVLKKISAIVNPDYISRRTALGQQIAQIELAYDNLKRALQGQAPPRELQDTEARLASLKRDYDARKPGYAASVQKQLLDVQASVTRAGMALRQTDLLLWSSPLGLAIRESTLPEAGAPELKAIRETVCLNQYKAICVNLSAASMARRLQVSLNVDNKNSAALSLRPAFFAKARDGSSTADAIGEAQQHLTVDVPAWSTQQIILWVDTKRASARPGVQKAALQIAVEGEGGGVRKVPIEIKVADVRLAARLPMSVSNWAYFYMGSTKVTEGLEKEAVANLRDYGANTWNLDYSQIPLPVLDAQGKYAGLAPETLKSLHKVLELLKGHREEEFVVWLGFQRAEIREALGKPGVLEGYLKDLRQVLDRYEIPLDKRFMMLWDEPKLPEVRETLQWMRKIRALDPSFKFYEDGSEILEPGEFEEFLRLTDRWLPNWEQFHMARPEDAKKVASLNKPGLGFYRCLMSRNNRGVNIYEYYRLMGWYTMQHGFGTLAFWVHNVGDGDAWDGTTGSSSGGVMVYKRDGKLLTSRRWELFREGLDDYKLAQAALKTEGLVDARRDTRLGKICRDVAARPTDFGYADSIRNTFIEWALKR